MSQLLIIPNLIGKTYNFFKSTTKWIYNNWLFVLTTCATIVVGCIMLDNTSNCSESRPTILFLTFALLYLCGIILSTLMFLRSFKITKHTTTNVITIKSGDKTLQYKGECHNCLENKMTFHVSHVVLENHDFDTATFLSPNQTSNNKARIPFVDEAFKIDGIKNISLSRYEIDITKGSVYNWSDLAPQILNLLFKHFAKPLTSTPQSLTDDLINPSTHCKDCLNKSCQVKLISTCNYEPRYTLVTEQP